jgi:DNA-directed RNA polymerase specialized sigma24 family protein
MDRFNTPRVSRSPERRPGLPHLDRDELDDIAVKSADDALLAVLSKLDQFRGTSRFTTWAYKFILLETAVKLRRHPRHLALGVGRRGKPYASSSRSSDDSPRARDQYHPVGTVVGWPWIAARIPRSTP